MQLKSNTFKHNDLILFYDIFIKQNELILIGPMIPSLVKYELLEIYCNDIKILVVQIVESKHTYIAKGKIEGEQHNTNKYNIKIKYLTTEVEYICEDEDFSFLKNKFGLTTIFKDENHLIDSWIDYHKRIGVKYFFLYNNNPSNKQYYDELEEKYKGCIYFYDWGFPYYLSTSENSGQTTQQNHTIYKYRELSLLGLTDLDEYIVPKKDFKIECPEGHCGISIESFWFGCNHHIEFTNNNFIMKLNKRQKQSCGPNFRMKCVVNPSLIILFCTHIVVKSVLPIKYTNTNEIQLNHYLIQSIANRKCNCALFDNVEDTSIITIMDKETLSNNENK
jgi:hypothetical protein